MRYVAAMVGLWVALTVAGCNTIQGIGKDLQTAGRSVSKAASER